MKKELVIMSLLSLIGMGCAKTMPYPKNSPWAQTGMTALEKVEINGVKHSVLIRGTDLANPLLLYIHPAGIPSMAFAHLEYADTGARTEQQFTVVHYDQRGYGKTYRKGGRRKKDLTIAQYIDDATQLVRYLRKRFDKSKIYVVAESWGSVIGTHMVSKHPEWFHAYVGVGQVSNVRQYMDVLYDFCEQSAKAENNTKAIEELSDPGRPTPEMSGKQLFKSLQVAGKWADRYQAKSGEEGTGAGFFFKSLWNAPEYSFFDFQATLTAFMTTQKKTIKELMTVNLAKTAPAIDVPVYFVMGENDLWRDPAREYFETLKAKDKHWIVIENAGHMTRGDAPEQFIDIMVDRVSNPSRKPSTPHQM